MNYYNYSQFQKMNPNICCYVQKNKCNNNCLEIYNVSTCSNLEKKNSGNIITFGNFRKICRDCILKQSKQKRYLLLGPTDNFCSPPGLDLQLSENNAKIETENLINFIKKVSDKARTADTTDECYYHELCSDKDFDKWICTRLQLREI